MLSNGSVSFLFVVAIGKSDRWHTSPGYENGKGEIQKYMNYC